MMSYSILQQQRSVRRSCPIDLDTCEEWDGSLSSDASTHSSSTVDSSEGQGGVSKQSQKQVSPSLKSLIEKFKRHLRLNKNNNKKKANKKKKKQNWDDYDNSGYNSDLETNCSLATTRNNHCCCSLPTIPESEPFFQPLPQFVTIKTTSIGEEVVEEIKRLSLLAKIVLALNKKKNKNKKNKKGRFNKKEKKNAVFKKKTKTIPPVTTTTTTSSSSSTMGPLFPNPAVQTVRTVLHSPVKPIKVQSLMVVSLPTKVVNLTLPTGIGGQQDSSPPSPPPPSNKKNNNKKKEFNYHKKWNMTTRDFQNTSSPSSIIVSIKSNRKLVPSLGKNSSNKLLLWGILALGAVLFGFNK